MDPQFAGGVQALLVNNTFLRHTVSTLNGFTRASYQAVLATARAFYSSPAGGSNLPNKTQTSSNNYASSHRPVKELRRTREHRCFPRGNFETVSLCSPGWPQTQIHMPLPPQLGLKVCATTTSPHLLWHLWINFKQLQPNSGLTDKKNWRHEACF